METPAQHDGSTAIARDPLAPSRLVPWGRVHAEAALELGVRVRDRLTGLEGVAVEFSRRLGGADRYALAVPIGPDGESREEVWVDAAVLEVLGGDPPLGFTRAATGP